MQRLHFVTALGVLLSFTACSSDTKSSTTEPPSSSTSSITAAKGGSVTAGSAELVVPGGSLSGDTMVTVKSSTPSSTLPELSTVKGLVYEFGPSGTKFNPPATLKLPLPGAPSRSQVAVMSWLDTTTNTWVDLDSTVSANDVSAPVAHFTMFVIRFKDAPVGAVDCSFSACGGDLSGDWTVQGACMDKGDAGVDAGAGAALFGASCPTATVDATIDASGMVSFNADKTFIFDLSTGGTTTILVPASCFAKLMIKSCDDLTTVFHHNNDAGVQTICTGDATKGCSCAGGGGQKSGMMVNGTYTTSGNSLTTTNGDAGSGDASEYCVSGSTLKVKTNDGTIITATKK